MRNRYLELCESRVKVRVKGHNVQRYLKRIIQDKIHIIRIIPISIREVELLLDYQEYLKLMEYKSIYEVKVLRYYGTKRWGKELKNNSILFSFMVVGLILILFFSRVISQVEVIHQDSSIRSYLLDELKKYGIKRYSFKKGYDALEKIEDKILSDNKDKLEWIEIIEYGTKYTVRVETRKLNEDKEVYQLQHIVSRKNAVISRIEAIQGEKVKFVNDYVKKGDIVISGNITLPDNTSVVTMAKGRVYGEVWYQVTLDYPYVYQESKLTGNSKTVYAIYFFNKRYGLFNFSKYRTFESKRDILFSFNLLDIQFVREKQYETLVRDEIYTDSMVEVKAREYVKKKLMRDNPYIRKILEMRVLNKNSDSKGVFFKIFTKVEEDIGEVLPIDGNDLLEEKERS